MKKLLALVAILTSFIASAQSGGTFTIFAEEGQKFWLIINGERYNQTPQARVVAKGVEGTRAKIKVIFEDKKLGTYDDAVYVRDVDGDLVYSTWLLRRKKDKWVMRLSDYDDGGKMQDAVNGKERGKPERADDSKMAPKKEPTEEQQTEEDHTTVPSMEIDMPGAVVKTDKKGNTNVKVTMPGVTIEDQDGQTTTTTTTTKTTRTTTKKTNPQHIIHMKLPDPKVTIPTTDDPRVGQPVPQEPAKPVATTAPAGVKAISASAYSSLLANIKRQGFEETRLKLAKSAVAKNLFTTDQIMGLVKAMNFEASRLDLAKAAYKNCSDKDHYLDITQAFNFSASTDELNEFIDKQ